MSVPSSLRFMQKAIFVPLLLMGLWLPSHVYGETIVIDKSGNYPNNKALYGNEYVLVEMRGTMSAHFVDFTAATGRVYFDFEQERSSASLTVQHFVCKDSSLHFGGFFGSGGKLLIEDGLFTFSEVGFPYAIRFSMFYRESTYIYILNVVVSETSFPVNSMVSLEQYSVVTTVKDTALHLLNSSSSGSDTMIQVEGRFIGFESITVIEANCSSCRYGFFNTELASLNIPFLIFDSCINKIGPFINGTEKLTWSTTEHFVLSRILTPGGIFVNAPTAGFTLPGGARVTLFSITAGSLVKNGKITQLFTTIPIDAEVYVGPMVIDGESLLTPAHFDAMKTPYTRLLDLNRMVLDVRKMQPPGTPYLDWSSVGDVSASHCMKYFRTGTIVTYNPETNQMRGACICKDDIGGPYCQRSYLQYGIPDCPFFFTRPLGEQTCVQCFIANCGRCDKKDECAHCVEGYFVTADKKCDISIPNCIALSSYGERCTACKADSRNLVLSVFGQSCVTCSVKNCKVCSEDEKCALCENGYAVNDAYKCNIPITGCLTPFNADPKRCTTCYSGYILTEKRKCVPTIDGCTTYAESGQCTQCSGDLVPSEDGASCIACPVPNCDKCSTYNQCSTCKARYSLMKGSCLSCDVNNCLRCEKENKCKECTADHEMNKDGRCVYFNNGCFRLDVGAPCFDCKEGLSVNLDQSACVSCTMKNCKVCSEDEKCASCECGYALDDANQCNVPITGCLTPSNADPKRCTTCNADHSLTEKRKCVPTIDGCTTYAESGQCTQCSGDLVPSEDGASCIACPVPNCDKCSTYNQCSTCEAKYSLVDGSCLSCDVNDCLRCEEKNKCKECAVGYDVTPNGKCGNFINGCFRPNDDGVCMDCKTGYNLTKDNRCVECQVVNCALCLDTNVCESCAEGAACSLHEEDTSKGIPWWVWLIVGLAAAVVVGLIIFFIVWCCCCEEKEFNVVYHYRYSTKEQSEEGSFVRKWETNDAELDTGRMVVVMATDNVRPRVYKQSDNSIHGDANSFVDSSEDISSQDDFTDSDF